MVNDKESHLPNGSSPAAYTGGPVIVLHGGSGDVPLWRVPLKERGVRNAAKAGYDCMLAGGSAVDAVEAALRSMEDDEYLNAGYGSVLNLSGEVEMDASIMDGTTLKAGCVCLVQDISHPVTLARTVMDKSDSHWTSPCFYAAHGAMKFAQEQGFELLPKGALETPFAREALEKHIDRMIEEKRMDKSQRVKKNFGEVGTVGAVAMDANGNIAAATTTGGMTGKVAGRIGDTPIIGSGTYADSNVGGTSSTGTGEVIMRYNLAHNVIKRMEWLGQDAATATREAVTDMTDKMTETAGTIAIDRNGNVGVYFTSNIMPWAIVKDGHLSYGTNLTDVHHDECSSER